MTSEDAPFAAPPPGDPVVVDPATGAATPVSPPPVAATVAPEPVAAEPVVTTEKPPSSKSVRVLGIIVMVAGVILIVAGTVTWFLVSDQLADEKIVVSDDADHFAGDKVDGPLTAYSEAETIKKHALEAGDGKTYAELPQDDPRATP